MNTNIIIAGTSVTFVSPHKLEDIKRVEKYNPDATCLFNDQGDVTFFLTTGKNGMIACDNLTYSATAPDDTGRACVTVPLPVVSGKPAKVAVAEVYGPAVAKANKVEEQIEAALTEVNAMLETITASIQTPGAVADDTAQAEG